jgi:DNA end-binding protein Ku
MTETPRSTLRAKSVGSRTEVTSMEAVCRGGLTEWWITPDLGQAIGMARTIWKGSLSFGLVNVPIGVYPATQDKSIHFNQFERGTSDRIRYKKVNERTGKEVESANIVKGVDLGGGEYVILDEDELAAAEPERSRYIEITDFVSLNEIDPVYFNTTYYLAPEGETAGKAYALLRQAMQDSGKVAIATFVMRNKEYLVAIRPEADVLALETMRFADEVRSPLNELPNLANSDDPSEREIKMAELLIESMEGEWDPSRYHDTHRQKIEALIEEKRQGRTIVAAAAAPAASKVVDLMAALSASIEAQSGTTKPAARRSAAGAKKAAKPAPAKVSAAKKVTKAPAAKAPRRKAS